MHIIGGKFKKRALVAPKTEKVRPTTSQLREAFFNICQLTIDGARFCDLFAGSGAMGLEALSRGAAHATFVENNRLALAAIKKNIAALQVEQQTTVLHLDTFRALQLLYGKREKFDLIYADPPYGEGLSLLLLDFLDSHPLLTNSGSLFIEECALHAPSLKNLKLRGQRKVGRAHLYEWRRVKVS
jgi:16S rRNA (guanine966-N2)-methyltransferase